GRIILVADESQRVAPGFDLALAQQLHPHEPAIEIDRLIEVKDADHRVQQPEAAGSDAGSRLRTRRGVHLFSPQPRCVLRAIAASTSSAARRAGDTPP